MAERLKVEDLDVRMGRDGRPIVRGVSLEVAPGEAYGLVGESGSGKTMTIRAVLGLLPAGGTASGQIELGPTSLLSLSQREMRSFRGSRIGMVFQDPAVALNPLLRVGDAIAQVCQSHQKIGRRPARLRATELMSRVGIRDAGTRCRDYPHQFSGGMRQRVMIAMALAARPQLLLADEPTTALDVVVQAGILRLLDQLRREESMSLVLVSHDFSIVAGVCDRVGVMYAGEIVEEGPVAEVLFRPSHPYTQALIESLPERSTSDRIPSIPGSPPEAGHFPVGCAFAPRCRLASDDCRAAPIPAIAIGEHHFARCIHTDVAQRATRMTIERA
jgi:oligopeptide/dipeptide ABC transporter ATP-binding protein